MGLELRVGSKQACPKPTGLFPTHRRREAERLRYEREINAGKKPNKVNTQALPKKRKNQPIHRLVDALSRLELFKRAAANGVPASSRAAQGRLKTKWRIIFWRTDGPITLLPLKRFRKCV